MKGDLNRITFCILVKAYPKLSNSYGDRYSFIIFLSSEYVYVEWINRLI